MNKTLAIVGTGIKTQAHMTQESVAYIEDADKVFFLVNEPHLKEYIRELNTTSEDLDPIYHGSNDRSTNYANISKHVLESFSKYSNITFVAYGHPALLATPTILAAKEAERDGINVLSIPAISAESYLFADLKIDPGNQGWQCYEATDFLIRERKFDSSAHLVLWQIGAIGLRNVVPAERRLDKRRLDFLSNYLQRFYKSEHEVIIYEGSVYNEYASTIETMKLSDISKFMVCPITTLYVPPLPLPKSNEETLEFLLSTLPTDYVQVS